MADKKPIAREATVGQPVQVILQSMVGSTGYGWQLTSLTEGLGLMSVDIRPIRSGIAPVNHIFNFLALKVGTCKVQFQLIAPWKTAEPAETVEYEFTIKAKEKNAADDIAAAMKGSGFVGAPVVNVGAEACAHPMEYYGIPCVSGAGMGAQTVVPDYGIPTMEPGCYLKYGFPTTTPMGCAKYGIPPVTVDACCSVKYGVQPECLGPMPKYGIHPACQAAAQNIGTAMQGFVGAQSPTVPTVCTFYGCNPVCQTPAQNIGTAMQGFVGAQSPTAPTVCTEYGCLPPTNDPMACTYAYYGCPPVPTAPSVCTFYGCNPVCQTPAQNIGTAMQGFVGTPPVGTGTQMYTTTLPILKYGYYGECQTSTQNIGTAMQGFVGAQSPTPITPVVMSYYGYPSVCQPMCPPGGAVGMGAQAPAIPYGTMPQCNAGATGMANTMMPYACPPVGGAGGFGAQGPMVPYGTWPPYCG